MSKKQPLTIEQATLKELQKINERVGCLVLAFVVLPLVMGVIWLFS